MIHDFRKLDSPFIRREVEGKYVCTPEIDKRYTWVWSEKCLAVDKLDGTNVSLYFDGEGKISIYNRMNEIDIWRGKKHFYDGVKNAFERDYLEWKKLRDTQVFGELIGPDINANPYCLTEAIWVPFSHLKEKCAFKFWGEFVKECEGKSEGEIFEKTSNAFKGLWSIYKRQRGIKGTVDENTVFDSTNMSAEGIVFYHKDTGEMCKLRRDMFTWYKGRSHGGRQ